jgi:nucleotide-binding universal stress UspA family protein
MKKPVLVAFDFSHAARAALALAARDLDEKGGGTLVVVHAFELTIPTTGAALPGLDVPLAATEALQRTLEHDARIALAREVRAVHEHHPRLIVDVDVIAGPPVEAILAAIGARDAERVVIGTHGRSGVESVLLGSVALRIARLAPVPVTVVKAPRAAPPAVSG